MYFYRILSVEELRQKKIHNNENSFHDLVNTHKYKKNCSYIHLFLNAESCFEDFEKENYDKCCVVKFDVPDEIVCRYGIGLGGYNPIFNSYNKKYRIINKNGHFWIPEIAIPSFDFNYDWCCDISSAVDKNGNCYLPDSFISDEIYYRQIVYDGYLLGLKDENELLQKYKQMIDLKKHIITVLKTTKKINIDYKNLNQDSLLAFYSLVEYAKSNNFIKDNYEITLSVSEANDLDAINITSYSCVSTVIDKRYNHSFPTFCSQLELLGIKVDYDKKVKDKQLSLFII